MQLRFLLTLALAATAIAALAQQTPDKPKLADAGAARVEFVSPDVHADRTITFKINVPRATDISLHFRDTNYPMQKGADGIWSTTIGPFEPEIYTFHYVVDGAHFYNVIDGAGTDNKIVEIPGNPPRYDEVQKVPHGVVVLHTYDSRIQGRTRHFRVYLPPQYYAEPGRKFPVMYLFNGFDDIEWTQIGKADVVMDNLIAEKKVEPMILVMPFNRIHGENIAQLAPYAAQATTAEQRAGLASSLETVAVLEKELPQEILPIVEHDYRVIADRDHRAIAGLSFGGGSAFGIAVRHMEMFGYLAEFATGIFGGTANPSSGYVGYAAFNPDAYTADLYKKMADPKTRFKLFYMACGSEDPRLPFQKAAYAEFQKQGVMPLVFEELPGGHEYYFFRRAMANFAMRLFK